MILDAYDSTISKKELIAKICKHTYVSNTDVKLVVNLFIKFLAIAMAEKKRVNLHYFGQFVPRFRQPRKGVNVHTGFPFIIPRTYVVSFKTAAHLKKLIKQYHSKLAKEEKQRLNILEPTNA